MKKNLYIIAMALGLIACTREELPCTDQDANPSLGQNTMTIIACTEKPDITRTELSGNDSEGYDVFWSAGDQIKIGSETFTLTEGSGTTKGVFSGAKLPDGSYDAYYATDNGQIPTGQTYTAGKIANSPMHASVTVSNGEANIANFTNIGGLLRLTIKKVKAVNISKIIFNGELNSSSKQITLDCSSSPVEVTEEGSEFFIAMPAGTYERVSIELDIKDEDLNMVKTLSSNNSIRIESSKITRVSFKTNSYNRHEFVDLGLSVLWATCNVGAGNPDEFGSYFTWADIESGNEEDTWTWTDYKWSGDDYNTLTKYNFSLAGGSVVDNLDTILPEDDAASVKWDSPWRIPTRAEMEELIQDCYWSYEDDYNSTGVQGYRVYKIKTAGDYTPSDPHIFLPSAGKFYADSNGTTQYWNPLNANEGYYWTSSYQPDDQGQPRFSSWESPSLYFSGSNLRIYPNTRRDGLTIRPVC